MGPPWGIDPTTHCTISGCLTMPSISVVSLLGIYFVANHTVPLIMIKKLLFSLLQIMCDNLFYRKLFKMFQILISVDKNMNSVFEAFFNQLQN